MSTNRTSRQMSFIDPKYLGDDQVSTQGSGFVKRNSNFRVSDDLVVTPKNATSTFCALKKFHIHIEDVEVQKVSISKAHALNLLRASLVTSSALNTAFRSLIVWKSKEEKVSWNPISKKPKVEVEETQRWREF